MQYGEKFYWEWEERFIQRVYVWLKRRMKKNDIYEDDL